MYATNLVSNLKANAVAVLSLPAMLAARWRIQSRRRVTVAAIDALLTHSLPPLQRRRFERLGLARRPR